MRGSLYVIPDDQPLPPPEPDELTRQFVRRWVVDDLKNEADQLTDRSWRKGREVFISAGCIKCHRMKGEGATVGPDLSDVSKQFRGSKLLKQILEPSAEINKKFQTWMTVTTEGRIVNGLLSEQSDTHVVLTPNPLKPADKVRLARDDIDELVPSKKSTMPEGLLMTYTREEILDLLSYLQQ